jgi:hypothetical protein
MATYIQIASVTVGSGGAATIDFSSIPATYTDLVLLVSGRSTRGIATDTLLLKFNNTATTYTNRRLYGTGTAAASDTYTITGGFDISALNAATSTASTFTNQQIYIPNYTGSTQKSISYDGVQENNSSSAFAVLFAGLWNGTGAINQITLTPDVGSFVQYSTASLYGIKNS